jgi:hypothetical protein
LVEAGSSNPFVLIYCTTGIQLSYNMPNTPDDDDDDNNDDDYDDNDERKKERKKEEKKED